MAAEKNNSLSEKIANLTKKYGAGAVLVGDEVVSVERLSTGSLALDIITGGGYGLGRIIELYGPESSGKTTISIHALVEAQKAFPKKMVAVIDAEHALDKDYCEALGLDMSKAVIAQPSCGEEALDIAEELLSSGEISVMLIDSVAALVPKAEIDGEMSDSQMGLQARLMSKAMRKLTGLINKTNSLVIFTNQLRSKIGVVYGSPEVTSGGNALKFYASIRIDVRKAQGEKNGDEVLTSLVTCKTVKNKLAPPFRKCQFEIEFGKGIDRVGEVISVAEAAGLIIKKGSWYYYGETKLAQGFSATKELLKDNLELVEEITKIVKKNIE